MKKKFIDTNSVYFKYIVTYIALLCIPMLFFIIVYTIFEENVEQETLDTHEYKMTQTVSQMDTCLERVIDASYELSILEDLNLASADQYDYYIIQQQLKNITARDNLFFDVGIYSSDSPYVLTANSEYSSDDFIRNYLGNGLTPSETIAEISADESILKFNVSQNSDIVTLIAQPPFLDGNSMILFMIEKQSFDALISDILFGHDDENIMFIGRDHSIKYAKTTPEPQIEEYALSDRLSSLSDSHVQVFEDRIGSQSYIVSYTRSNYLNMHYLLLTPKSAYFGEVYLMRSIVLGLFAFMLVLGVFMIYIAMKLNYNPLKSIYERTLSLSGLKSSDNELDAINKSLDIFADKEKQYIAAVSASHESIRNAKLLKLLRTEIDKEVFLSEADNLDLDTDNAYYRVVTIHICHDMVSYSRSDVEKWLKSNFTRYFDGIYVDIYDNENFAFVVQQNNDELLVKELNILRADITAEFGLIFCIGVGKSYYDIEDIKNSSMESVTAIQYSYIYGYNTVIEFSKLNTDKGHTTINISKDLELLKTLFNSGNTDECTAQIKHIIEKIKSSGSNLVSVKRAVIELVGLTAKWIDEADIYRDQKITEKNSVAALSMDAIASAETLDIVEDLLINVCTYLYDRTAEEDEPDDEAQALRVQFINYINENCYNADFSLKQMASEFNITQSYLSQRFKVITGQTISSYVNNKRIEKAKDLLINSDILIKDIIYEIGYYDVSSFLRKFKQCEGITPGAYRAKYKVSKPEGQSH